MASVDEALTYFATHPARVKALFGLYLDQMASATGTAEVVAA
jgi:hypothetical protein